MINATQFHEIALALDGAFTAPHFDRTAYRTKRAIFATLPRDGRTANLKLTPKQQAELVDARPDAYEVIPGGWGRMGYTTVTLANVTLAEIRKVLALAHESVLPRSTRRAPAKAVGKPRKPPRR